MADFDSSLPIRTETNGDAAVRVVDGTVTSQALSVDSSGKIHSKLNDGAGTEITSQTNGGQQALDVGINVSGVQVDPRDIRALVNTDIITVEQPTHDNLNLNANLQVGDADVADINPVPISDAGGSLTVDAVDLDIRDLVHATDSVSIGDGTDILGINTDGSINVVVVEDPGTEIVNYNTAAAVASAATSNHDYTTLAASKLFQVFASASGRLKIEVQIETGAATGVFNTIAVGFNSTANPNINLHLAKYAPVSSGARIRVIRTNGDNQSQDLYSTIVAIQG